MMTIIKYLKELTLNTKNSISLYLHINIIKRELNLNKCGFYLDVDLTLEDL